MLEKFYANSEKTFDIPDIGEMTYQESSFKTAYEISEILKKNANKTVAVISFALFFGTLKNGQKLFPDAKSPEELFPEVEKFSAKFSADENPFGQKCIEVFKFLTGQKFEEKIEEEVKN